jgi:hypothetical protein
MRADGLAQRVRVEGTTDPGSKGLNSDCHELVGRVKVTTIWCAPIPGLMLLMARYSAAATPLPAAPIFHVATKSGRPTGDPSAHVAAALT